MSAALEARYRAALRWYPRAWRAENADAIVGTMLDQADAEARTVPARGEMRDLAESAIRTRLSGLNAFYPAAVRDRVALIALVLGAAVSLLSLTLTEWAPYVPREAVHVADGGFYVPPLPQFGPFFSIAALLYATWLLALIAVLARQRAISTVLLALTLPFSAVIYVFRPEPWALQQAQAGAVVILAGLALLAIMGNARTPLSLSRLSVALLAGLAISLFGLLTSGVAYYSGRMFGGTVFTFFEPRTLLTALLVLAVYGFARRLSTWTLALLLSALPWLLLSALYFLPVVLVAAPAGMMFGLVIAFGVWNGLRHRTAAVD